MKIPNSILTLLVGIVLTLASVWYSQHNNLLPTAASVEAARIDQLFNAMVAIAVGLFLLVQGALVYSLFAFRQRPGDDTDAEPVHGNVAMEIVWTAVPSVVVLWLAIYSFDVYQSVNSGGYIGAVHMAHAHPQVEVVSASATESAPGATAHKALASTDGSEPTQATPATNSNEPLVVDISGFQYAWLVTHRDTGIISGDLHVPLNRPVELNLTSRDVIHAFWVPQFRLKQDVIPGQETHLRFIPNRLGTYPIICAELCGAYHGAMKTQVIVQSLEDYQAWEQSRQVAAQPDPAQVALSPQEQRPDVFLAPHLHSMKLPTDLAMVPAEASK